MPAWLFGQASTLGEVAGKAALMYVVVVVGLRFAHRRLLSQWTSSDFAAAVAVGAILGRTAIASGQSFLVGAVALTTLLAAHWLTCQLRWSAVFARGIDHRICVLVEHGEVRRHQLWRCGVTRDDLLSHLRLQGVERLEDVRYVLYEPKGGLTVVRESDTDDDDPALVATALREAANYP